MQHTNTPFSRVIAPQSDPGAEVSADTESDYYRRIENAEGYVLIGVYLFIYLFVCVFLA